MTDFTEVGDRCWVARYPWMDVNVTVVAGERGLLVVDTNTSTQVARGVVDDLRRLSGAPLLHVVNTHVHFDHTFGNGVFAAEGAELVAHEAAAAALPAHARSVKEQAAGDAVDDQRYAGIAETDVVVPGRTFSSALALDLGDRFVELVHPGRGHTGGDLVVRLPDADVLLAGDLVEESADRGHVPGYGDDCWPMDWPATLDLVIGLLGEDTVVVPGHGAPVDRDFVERQRSDVGVVAETIRHAATQGTPLEDALAQAEWPYPVEALETAVRRGYAQLSAAEQGRRHLPLL